MKSCLAMPRLDVRNPMCVVVCLPQVKCYALSPDDDSAWRRKIASESEHFCDVSGLQVCEGSIDDVAIAAIRLAYRIRCTDYLYLAH